jgi:hypothetical protein
MGAKSGGEIEVNEYLLSMHVGVASTVDALTSIYVGEKLAWSGEQKTQAALSISKPSLFGGEKKEGGVVGTVYYLPGLPTQVLPDNLAQKLGRASGADCPGFRGLTTLFFTGGGGYYYGGVGGGFGTGSTGGGFQWVTNNPYLKDVWVGVKRAPKGLDPETAMIPRLGGTGLVSFVTGQSVTLKWWQSALTKSPVDQARMGIGFFNGDNEIIGAIEWATMTATGAMVWTQRTLTATIPANTYSIRLYMEMQKLSGSYNDAYIDDVTLKINGADFPVTNGTAEVHNDYGWITETGALAVRFGSPTPHSGTGYFTGGAETLTRVYQSFTQAASGEDANPSHIIYECLTNREWGMGAASTAINVTSFQNAAVTLLVERLGLSLIWTRQTTIEAFISEILDHIQAVLYVNPRDGLITLKLIRDDYTLGSLRQINPDNAKMTKFQRRGWGEITNEIVVTWSNPENEQDETVTIQDNAAIAAQGGGIVSDSRNYYGVRSSELAMKLAARDLRSSATLLATCDVELDRTAWDLLPGDVVKVYWPERGLNDVPMRVGPVDYGRPGDPKITASLMEDIFAFATTDYSLPPSTSWQDDDVVPSPMVDAKIITMPSFFAANYLPVTGTGLADITYPEVISGVLASSPNAIAFDMYGDVVSVDGTVSQQSLTTAAVSGHAELASPLSVQATSTFVGFKNFMGRVSPGASIFVFIGGAAVGDAASEIALITAQTDNTFTLKRGVLDTVPRVWNAGTICYFVQLASKISDLRIRSDAEVVTYKLLSRTVGGILDVADAPTLSGTLNARPHLPLRPANVKVDGVATSKITIAGASSLALTWANRNRTLENSQVVYWDDATVTPEAGQTTKIVVYDASNTVVSTASGLTGTSHTLSTTGMPTTGKIRFTSERDSFESLQGYEVAISTDTAPPDPGTGGGTGGFPATVSWTSFNTISSTAYVALTTAQTVTVAAGDTLDASAALTYVAAGARRTMTIKCQYRIEGTSTWIDTGVAVTGSLTFRDGETGFVESGGLVLSQSVAGLVANDYEVRFVALASAGGFTLTSSGTASVGVS